MVNGRALAIFGALAMLRCSSFGAGSGSGGTPEPDAGPRPDAARVDEDAAVPPAVDSGACALAFCERFDVPDWQKRWSTSDKATLTVVSDHVSPPASLELFLSGNRSTQRIARALPTGKAVYTLRTKFKVIARGNGEIDFAELRFAIPTGDLGFHLSYAAGVNSYVIESSDKRLPVTATFVSWTSLVIEVNVDRGEFRYAIDGVYSKPELAGSGLGTATGVTALFGAPFASGATVDWRVRFDDIELGPAE